MAPSGWVVFRNCCSGKRGMREPQWRLSWSRKSQFPNVSYSQDVIWQHWRPGTPLELISKQHQEVWSVLSGTKPSMIFMYQCVFLSSFATGAALSPLLLESALDCLPRDMFFSGNPD
ncbi:hypothetical protein KOW79_005158 [Hemibagrus wyckioides]|uniref:Uncharacterized protein n=1 Tax=Hemibagrus wyckioides TaxID=337641 RepID=A0A9D3STC8_9TELE|nr:hypothetical protein KOW79_005158 [Hemibagrus wyckioides]